MRLLKGIIADAFFASVHHFFSACNDFDDCVSKRLELIVNLPETLKSARSSARFGQQDAAKQIGISTPTLQRYESGDSSIKVDILMRMAEAYGCSPAYLLGLSQNPELDACTGVDSLSPEEQQIVDAYRAAGSEDRWTLLRVASLVAYRSRPR